MAKSLQALSLTLFTTLTGRQYAAAKKKFNGEAIAKLVEDYKTYTANAVGHAIVEGDVCHVNGLIQAARNFNRFNQTKRITRSVMAWDYNTSLQQFDGKADKAKLKSLRTEVDVEVPGTDDEGNDIMVTVKVQRWEQKLAEAFDREAEKTAKANEEDWSTDFLRLVTTLCRRSIEHNEEVGTVTSAIEKGFKDIAA